MTGFEMQNAEETIQTKTNLYAQFCLGKSRLGGAVWKPILGGK